VAKFSAVLLAPMFAMCALVWLVARMRAGAGCAAGLRLTRTTAVHVAIAWATIWLFYGFRFSAFAPALADGANFNHGWGWLVSDLGWPRAIILRLPRMACAARRVSLRLHIRGAVREGARGAFHQRRLRRDRLGEFFSVCVSGEEHAAVARAAARRRDRAAPPRRGKNLVARLRPWTPLLALFGVYWATSLTSHLNIGDRHILPTYPVLFIAAGAFGPWLDRRRPLAALLVGALALGTSRSRGARGPNYLAAFNAIAGGTTTAGATSWTARSTGARTCRA